MTTNTGLGAGHSAVLSLICILIPFTSSDYLSFNGPTKQKSVVHHFETVQQSTTNIRDRRNEIFPLTFSIILLLQYFPLMTSWPEEIVSLLQPCRIKLIALDNSAHFWTQESRVFYCQWFNDSLLSLTRYSEIRCFFAFSTQSTQKSHHVSGANKVTECSLESCWSLIRSFIIL